MSFPAIQPRVQPVSQNIILPNAKEMNYALEFDGEDDYVEIPNDNSLVGMSELTLQAKFYLEEIKSTHQRILSIWRGDTDAYQIFVWSEEDGDGVSFEIKTDSDSEYLNIDAENEVSTQKWHTLTGVYDGEEMRVYLDGNLLDSKSITGDIENSTDDLFIGRDETDDKFFSGIISEVRIWNVGRTETEIQDNMNKELNGNETGLVAYYKMNEGSGDTLIDSAGSNDGQIIGATWKEV